MKSVLIISSLFLLSIATSAFAQTDTLNQKTYDPFQGMKDSSISTIDFLKAFLNNKEVTAHFRLHENSMDTLYIIDANSLVFPGRFYLKNCNRYARVINNTTLDLSRWVYDDSQEWINHIQLTNLYFCDNTCTIQVFTKYRNSGGGAIIKETDRKFDFLDITLGYY